MNTEEHSSASDEEVLNTVTSVTNYQGTLNKWTNYIHGWQERFVVLKDGVLTYYKSENESNVGCRGAVSVYKCTVKVSGKRRQNQFFGVTFILLK